MIKCLQDLVELEKTRSLKIELKRECLNPSLENDKGKQMLLKLEFKREYLYPRLNYGLLPG